MYQDEKLWIAKSVNGERICIEPDKANRHGLIAGATGTGKTITLKVLAESFSDMGVPVFLADVGPCAYDFDLLFGSCSRYPETDAVETVF